MKTPKPQGYLNERAKEIYMDIAIILEKYDAVEDQDSYGLSMLADCLATYELAAIECNKHGPVQVYKTDAEGVSAWWTVKKGSWDAFLKLSQRYGLSVKDRELIMKFKAKRDEGDALDDLK